MDNEFSEKLYRAYYMRVYSYVMTLAQDKMLAEDITQDTFMKAFSSSQSFRAESDEFTWLCAIAKNQFYDVCRKRARLADQPPDPDMDAGIDIVKDVADKDQSFRIHMILHSIEEPYREVFELRVFGELSFREIGTIFGKTENWARVTFHRSRLKIRERMDDNEV